MQNATAKLSKDNKSLTITIDLTTDLGPSTSGKTILYASSRGNANVGNSHKGDAVMVGLNVFRYATPKA